MNEGPYEATIINEETNIFRHKNGRKLTTHESLTSNVKAMNVLCNSLNATKSIRVKGCKSTKELWDKLKETYKSSDDVKKKNFVCDQIYESFKIEPSKLHWKFNDIIKDLEALDKKYSLKETNGKILIRTSSI